MNPAELFRILRELEARARRLNQLLERLVEERELLADDVDRFRRCLERLTAGTTFTPPELDPTVRPARRDAPRRPRGAGFRSPILDPSPHVIDKLQIQQHSDGGATLVLPGEKPAETRRVRLPAAPAELLLVLAADDGRPRIGDCVPAKPNSELMRKLHTRTGQPLSRNALKQRVHVLRRYLVERGFLHRSVLSRVRVGGEPGYRLAVRHR